MILLKQALQNIEQHAEQGYPAEVVGILVGNLHQQTVSQTVPLTNLQKHTRARSTCQSRYNIDIGKEQWKIEKEIEDSGFDILGYYHSHPDHPSQFSKYDKDHALPNMNYLIISVQKGDAQQIQIWRLREDRSTMDEITTRTTTQQPKGESHDY